MTSVGLLIRQSLMTSLLQRKTRLLALTEFLTVPTDVLVAWVRSSSVILKELSWKELPFLIIVLKVELFLSPRPLTLMTMEGSFDLKTLFAR